MDLSPVYFFSEYLEYLEDAVYQQNPRSLQELKLNIARGSASIHDAFKCKVALNI